MAQNLAEEKAARFGGRAMRGKARPEVFVLGLTLGALLVVGVGCGLAALGYLRIHLDGPWFVSVALSIARSALKLGLM